MSTLLDQARQAIRPTREEMLQRAQSVQHFWNENKKTFEGAWTEWEKSGGDKGITLDRSLYAPALRRAVEQAWDDPTKESTVKALFTEVFPNVYRAQFFDPQKLHILNDYFQCAVESGIPMRPPYGIVLNRGGSMLDARSEGYLAAPVFQKFYRDLMAHFMRPIARLLFSNVYGYDSQTFGFSVQWQEGKDVDLRPHTDASSATLNINLNLPGEAYSGSSVRFFDPLSRRDESLTFEPGVALIHHGSVPHASEPITKGERRNIILWLFGERGQIPYPHSESQQASAKRRWHHPEVQPDNFAPF